MSRYFCVCAAMAVVLFGSRVDAAIRITEWMYQGAPAPAVPAGAGEFVELTNVGSTAIDMTGWSYDDDSRLAGTFSLSAFGTVQPGESVLFTDLSAEAFRTAWNLPLTTKVIGLSTPGLGRADEINIYNAIDAAVPVDRLTYDDQTLTHVRTVQVSANIPSALFNSDLASGAITSSLGDAFGSSTNTRGEVGNPGVYPTVPEPTSIALATGAMASVLLFRRRS